MSSKTDFSGISKTGTRARNRSGPFTQHPQMTEQVESTPSRHRDSSQIRLAIEAELIVKDGRGAEDIADLLFDAIEQQDGVDLDFACSTTSNR